MARAWRIFGRWAPGIAPQVLAFVTFVGGAVLLFSGATPTLGSRVRWLRPLVPLPLLEISHFFGSLAGGALLILARGLQRRLDAAYHLTVAVLSAGIQTCSRNHLRGICPSVSVILGCRGSSLPAVRR